jgi:hypothetical protein
MATFEAQVEALTSLSIDGSSAPTQTELTQFLTDGAKEILNSLPRSKQSLFTTSNDLNGSSPSFTVLGSEIFSVTRDDGTINQPCRIVRPELNGRIRDADDMMAATTTDPAYYVTNNILVVVPSPTNAQNAHVHTLNYPAVAFGDSAIAKFPDDAEYLVPIYGAIKSLQNLMASKSSNTDIITALTAINIEIDECLSIADNMHTEIALINDHVDLAKNEADEITAFTDGSATINTALTAMNTAADKFREDNADPSLLGDESVYTTGTGLTSVKTHVDRAISYINGDFPNANYDLAANLADIDSELTNEDTELASGRIQQLQATLNSVDADLKIARAYIDEWNTLSDTLTKEVNAFASEVNARVSFTGAKSQAVKAYIDSANGYASVAQGYANEIQAKINIAQAYGNEVQARLAADTSEYSKYEKQQAKLQADYDKGLQALR